MTEEMGHQLHQAEAPEELGLPINIVDPPFDALNNNIYSVNAAGNCGAIPELWEPESVPPLLPSEHLVSTSSTSPLLPELQPMAMPDPFHAAAMFYQQQPPVLKRSRSNLINNEVLYSQQHHGQLHDRRQSDNVFSVSIGPPAAMELRVARVSSSSSSMMSRANGNMSNGSETRLSPQSVAARERRKRISNKTQELGRLVPGGHKMSTAEMFQAAAKYVKFLQAQVGILGLIPEYCNNQRQGSGGGEKELQQLLATTAIQEKLYRADRCIVPKKTVEDLVNDPVIKSHPSISGDQIKPKCMPNDWGSKTPKRRSN